MIKITQKDRGPLDEFRDALGCGHVRLSRGIHEYTIKDQLHVNAFVDLIYPYCRVKRRQLDLSREIAYAMKSIFDLKGLLKVAEMADELSACNVRSKNRRKNYVTKIHLYGNL